MRRPDECRLCQRASEPAESLWSVPVAHRASGLLIAQSPLPRGVTQLAAGWTPALI